MRRAVVVALVAGAFLVVWSPAAGAHALLRSSDPPGGALLQKAPPRVVITFTEPPEPGLSILHVLDQSGHDVEKGTAQPVPGKPLELQVALGPLPNGVYTVTWRTVSKTDGHVTGGSFAFGVGVKPTGATGPAGGAVAPSTPPPSPLAAVGRWALYWGLALLLSGAVIGLFAFDARLPATRWLLVAAWAGGAAGLVLMTLAERSTVGVPIGTLLRSSPGRELVRQGIGLSVAGVVVAIVVRAPGRAAMVILGLTAAAAMLLHALAGHAASASPVWFNVGVQWLHLLAVGVWVGGLVWLLLGTRKQADGDRRSVARFSFLAGIAVGVVAVTGVARALDEIGGVGAWRRLFDTSFGATLLIKVGLFAALIALGARNRYVNVPAVAKAGRGFRSLRRAVGAEVALAVGILGVTGVLTQLPPAALVAQTAARPTASRPLVVRGNDFATTVRVTLSVTPGTVGQNRFAVHIADFDTRKPVAARSVSLRFSIPDRPDIGASTVSLKRAGAGLWEASGTSLSIDARWSVVVAIQQATGGVEVPLAVRPREPPEQITVSQASGQPTLYTITLPGTGTLQTYVDPATPGPNTVHFTFFKVSGNEQPITSAAASATSPSGADVVLTLIRFDPGHFAANIPLSAGRWTFRVQATSSDGRAVSGYFSQQIGG